ncbi:unnamed protein product [Allacma fusca]|uniref:Uncharacterized protein n=1 Tax=Allacma fusca TaxID=39272 RepID=A0A8J2K3K0_9HEXA|nr:unnamed protein product [Allacma fusca]
MDAPFCHSTFNSCNNAVSPQFIFHGSDMELANFFPIKYPPCTCPKDDQQPNSTQSHSLGTLAFTESSRKKKKAFDEFDSYVYQLARPEPPWIMENVNQGVTSTAEANLKCLIADFSASSTDVRMEESSQDKLAESDVEMEICEDNTTDIFYFTDTRNSDKPFMQHDSSAPMTFTYEETMNDPYDYCSGDTLTTSMSVESFGPP